MKQADFNFNDIDYLFVFDYYDYPLSFISKKINGKYYFFYFIDYGTYILKELSVKNISLIFSDNPTKLILTELLKEKDVFIIEQGSTGDVLTCKAIEEYEVENSLTIEDYLPSDDSRFENDFISNQSFDTLINIYPNYFPGMFNNKDLTIKLIDENNSHASNPDIIISAINLMKTFISVHRENLKDSLSFPNDILQITPFTPGSFNINFELSKPEETTLFEYHDELNFDDFIIFFDSLIKDDPEVVYEDLVYENKDIIKATEVFYSEIKKSNTKVELLNNEEVKFSKLSHSEKADEYFTKLASLASQNEEVRISEEIINFKGTVASASKIRNHVTLELLSGNIKAKFEKELFKDIKEKEKIVSVSKEMKGQYKKRISFDKDGNEIGIKYEIINFNQ